MTDKVRARRKERYEKIYKPAYDAWIQHYPFTLDNLDGEQWKWIPNYEGSYQASTFGRIKSFVICPGGKILRPSLSNNGYIFVPLGRKKHFFVHVLVALTFIPNPAGKEQVNHRDGDKFNCHVSNLEWVTKNENELHSWLTGLRRTGEKHHNAKITYEQVLYIRTNPDNLLVKELSAKFGVSNSTISQIQTGTRRTFENGQLRESKTPLSLPDETKKKIRTDYRKGMRGFGAPALAKKYGTSTATVQKIINEK